MSNPAIHLIILIPFIFILFIDPRQSRRPTSLRWSQQRRGGEGGGGRRQSWRLTYKPEVIPTKKRVGFSSILVAYRSNRSKPKGNWTHPTIYDFEVKKLCSFCRALAGGLVRRPFPSEHLVIRAKMDRETGFSPLAMSAGLPISYTLELRNNFCRWGPILIPRPVLESPAQTTGGNVLDFFL